MSLDLLLGSIVDAMGDGGGGWGGTGGGSSIHVIFMKFMQIQLNPAELQSIQFKFKSFHKTNLCWTLSRISNGTSLLTCLRDLSHVVCVTWVMSCAWLKSCHDAAPIHRIFQTTVPRPFRVFCSAGGGFQTIPNTSVRAGDVGWTTYMGRWGGREGGER